MVKMSLGTHGHMLKHFGEHIGNMVGTPISKKIDSHNLLPFTHPCPLPPTKTLPPRGKKWVLLCAC